MIKRLFHALFVMMLLVYSFIGYPAASYSADQVARVYTIKVEETVTAGTTGNIIRGLETAREQKADAVVLLIDTPGGLVTATLDIIQAIAASPVPVITYVAPQGAIAASAGTFILLSGHVAAMAPGTTCGAAMPVTAVAPGSEPQAADQKTINFLAGHMKSIARERGRPEDLAGKFVTENLTLPVAEALKEGVIDLTAPDLEDLLNSLEGREVQTGAGAKILHTAGAATVPVPMNNTEKLINIFSNPAIASVLLMLGIYGLIIAYSSPGFYLPEVLGAIFLILGLYGMGLFQINITAVLLVVLGIVLIIVEAFTPTYGILGVGGVVSVVLGIMLFPREPLMPLDWFATFKTMALGVGVIGAGLMFAIIGGVYRLRKLKPFQGDEEFRGLSGLAVEDLDPRGQVKIKGEIWTAMSKRQEFIESGTMVKIVDREGLTLIVEADREQKE